MAINVSTGLCALQKPVKLRFRPNKPSSSKASNPQHEHSPDFPKMDLSNSQNKMCRYCLDVGIDRLKGLTLIKSNQEQFIVLICIQWPQNKNLKMVGNVPFHVFTKDIKAGQNLNSQLLKKETVL